MRPFPTFFPYSTLKSKRFIYFSFWNFQTWIWSSKSFEQFLKRPYIDRKMIKNLKYRSIKKSNSTSLKFCWKHNLRYTMYVIYYIYDI